MKIGVKYQGREATTKEVTDIISLMDTHPEYSRTKLSQELCKKWNWIQYNGRLKEQLCRSYLLAIEKAGHIVLPARKCIPNNPLANRKKPEQVKTSTAPITMPLSLLSGGLSIQQVRWTNQEHVYNSLIAYHHYLGYGHPIGEHLKYIIYFKQRPISCICFSSAPRHIGSRDTYIGWDQQARKKNIHLIAYNTRFLILPWVKVTYLASHILSLVSKKVSLDWESYYHHPVYLLETFVDTELFLGTCYKAANWIYVGNTTGRGKNDHTKKPNRSIKAVWCYPLHKKFRERLTHISY